MGSNPGRIKVDQGFHTSLHRQRFPKRNDFKLDVQFQTWKSLTCAYRQANIAYVQASINNFGIITWSALIIIPAFTKEPNKCLCVRPPENVYFEGPTPYAIYKTSGFVSNKCHGYCMKFLHIKLHDYKHTKRVLKTCRTNGSETYLGAQFVPRYRIVIA